jgi:predicted DNA-binding transcriptional regulator AlpA
MPATQRRTIRLRETSRRVGYTIPHIWRLERDGKFPLRIRLGENAVGHFEDEIDEWIRSRVRGGGRAVRRADPPKRRVVL